MMRGSIWFSLCRPGHNFSRGISRRSGETYKFIDEQAQQILFLLWLVAEQSEYKSQRLCPDVCKGVQRQCL